MEKKSSASACTFLEANFHRDDYLKSVFIVAEAIGVLKCTHIIVPVKGRIYPRADAYHLV